MPDQQFEPDDPREWLQRAQSNLIRARQQAPGVYLEDLCFDAQQAAEKSIKALLLHMDVPFPYTHDLADLITLVQRNGLSVPEEIKAATALSEYAVETRYPGLAEPVTEDEHETAVMLAGQTVRWVEQQINSSGEPSEDTSADDDNGK